MTEIEMHIDTLEKLIPEIEMGMNLFSYDRSALQAALQALRRTAKNNKAREEGRLVVLPCKVGDTLYEPYPGGGEDGLIDEAKVKEIEINIYTNMGVYDPADIGKTVFLTRQEAEAAL